MTNNNFKFISFIATYFVTILIISNIVSTKIVDFGIFSFDGGTLLFPLSYIIGDVMTEVYGYRESRKIIWMGVGALLLLGITVIIIGALPPSPDWLYQGDYENILGMTPRIILASIVAYLFGEFSNSYLMAKIKIWTKGRMLWVRTIGSTLVGELLDTSIFVFIAFYGVFGNELFLTIIVSNYVFKVGIEILCTPATYGVVNYLKKKERVDTYDHDTNFNPLSFK